MRLLQPWAHPTLLGVWLPGCRVHTERAQRPCCSQAWSWPQLQARSPSQPPPSPVPTEVPAAWGRGCPWLPCPWLGWWDRPWLPGPALPGPPQRAPATPGFQPPENCQPAQCPDSLHEGVCFLRPSQYLGIPYPSLKGCLKAPGKFQLLHLQWREPPWPRCCIPNLLYTPFMRILLCFCIL